MFAIFTKRSYAPFTILHTDVMEIENTDHPTVKKFKCACCGRTWLESINSPLIIEDVVAKNIRQYYDNVVTCNKC